MDNFNQHSRRYACDRCRGHKLRCNRDTASASAGPCLRCRKAKTRCTTTSAAPIGTAKPGYKPNITMGLDSSGRIAAPHVSDDTALGYHLLPPTTTPLEDAQVGGFEAWPGTIFGQDEVMSFHLDMEAAPIAGDRDTLPPPASDMAPPAPSAVRTWELDAEQEPPTQVERPTNTHPDGTIHDDYATQTAQLLSLSATLIHDVAFYSGCAKTMSTITEEVVQEMLKRFDQNIAIEYESGVARILKHGEDFVGIVQKLARVLPARQLTRPTCSGSSSSTAVLPASAHAVPLLTAYSAIISLLETSLDAIFLALDRLPRALLDDDASPLPPGATAVVLPPLVSGLQINGFRVRNRRLQMRIFVDVVRHMLADIEGVLGFGGDGVGKMTEVGGGYGVCVADEGFQRLLETWLSVGGGDASTGDRSGLQKSKELVDQIERALG